MAEPSTEMDAGDQRRMWKHSATRQAILDAARRLAAGEGIEAVTLSRVASEAGFAPPAVYAYFVSKDDLHLAVVADDLDKLARAMRGEDPAAEPEDDVQGVPADVPQADVIAFQPSASPDDESGEGDEVAADAGVEKLGPETGATEAAAPDIEEATSDSDAEEKAIVQDGGQVPEMAYDASEDVVGSMPDGEAQADVEDDVTDESVAADDVSLAAIEQAIGVVLNEAPEDFVEAGAPAEDVPDAFPEETVAPAAGETVAESAAEDPAALTPADEAFVERRAQEGDGDHRRSVSGFRWRRSRREDDAEQGPEQESLPLGKPAARVPAPSGQAMTLCELQEAVARIEARPVDAWLERRLRVFERTLADIEVRMEKAERDSSTALSTVSESFKALEDRLSETLDGASQQVSDSEQRHRAVTADLRLYVKDLSGRLAALETSLPRLLNNGDDGALPVYERSSAHEDEAKFQEAPSDEPAVKPAPAPASPRALHQPEGEGYLSVARRAANSAAAEAERARVISPLSYLKMASASAPGLSISRRGLQIVAGILTLLVLVIIASIALRGNPQQKPVSVNVSAPVTESADARVAAMAKAGNAKAELVVGLKLLNGDGVTTDIPSAAYWLTKSAAQRQPVAEYWLGTLYERGRGVPKDRAKAMQAYQAAARSGNAKAMYRLGVGYAEGWDGEANYAAAADWFTKAAKLGVIDAQFNLAVLYERGSGVPQSFAQAFKWYSIAAAQGDSESKARIDALAEHLSSAEAAAAQAEAEKFRPREASPAANDDPTVDDVAATQ